MRYVFFLFLFLAIPAFSQLPDPHQQVLSLNGSSYLSVPNSTALNMDIASAQMMTIDAWVKPTTLGGYMTIVGNDFVNGYWLGITPTGTVRFYPRGGVAYDSPGSIAANVWSHVAVSVNSAKGTIQFYINGILNTSVTVTRFTIGTSSSDLRIGADRSGSVADYFWRGELDEIRIWKNEINMQTAAGLLYRVPQGVINGLHGRLLSASWQCNGTALDVSGAHGGTLVGTPTFLSSPLPPHYPRICALLPNGGNSTDLFSFPSPALSLVQNFTLECWVSPASSGGDPNFQTLLSKGAIATTAWSYWLGINKTNGRLRFIGNGDFGSALESNNALPLGQWSHVAARCISGGTFLTLEVFINGQSAGQRTVAATGSASTAPMLVGMSQGGATAGYVYGYSGKIDEVRVWNTVRTSQEILDNMRLELNGPSPGLVAGYHMNGDLFDASGNGNSGTTILPVNSMTFFTDATDLPAPPTILVTAPNGGETWTIGTLAIARWSSTGLSSVIVELSRDGGSTFVPLTVAPVSASTGQYAWTVTDPPTSSALIRVTTATPTSVADQSNAPFTIAEPPPRVQADPASLQFSAMANGDLPLPKSVTLNNTGGGTLQWTATVQGGTWLDVVPASGTGNAEPFAVQITRTDLPPGIYQARVVIGGNAANAGLQIPISYTVLRPPCIAFSRDTVIFLATPGSSPSAQAVTILNGCDSVLFWSADPRDPWVSVQPSSGRQGDKLTISLNSTGLPIGDHPTAVEIAGNATNSPRLLIIILRVLSTPLFTVSGTVRSGGTGVGGVTITVTGAMSLSTETGADGSYSIGVMGGDYQFTPTSPFFTFLPLSRDVLAVTNNRNGVDFDARPVNGVAHLYFKEGWNLIALPLLPTDPRVSTLFPAASGPAYAYHPDSGYVARTVLEPGMGYWIKFTQSDSVVMHGALFGTIRISAAGRSGGWNLIGGPSGPASIARFSEDPASSLVTVYGYDPESGYLVPGDGSVRPGHGYFLRVRRDAEIGMIATTLAKLLPLRVRMDAPRVDVRDHPPAPPK